MHILKNEIEDIFCKKLGFAFGKLTNTGSEAIRYCLINAAVKKKTYIVVPVTICKSVVDAILEYGCYPYFVDVGNDFCLEYQTTIQNIPNNTSAIVYVHAYGVLKDITLFQKFCKEKDIILIEDSAQYICEYDRYKISPQGDFVVYSFGRGKPIDAGCYGFVASNTIKIEKYPILENEGNLVILKNKVLNIKSILQSKLKKVALYKKLLNQTKILDDPSFEDNIFHRLLYFCPQNYFEISNKMYLFMKEKEIDNYQSTIPLEAFRQRDLLKSLPKGHQDLSLNAFKKYAKLRQSYHYFRTCEWISKQNILLITERFNKVLNSFKN